MKKKIMSVFLLLLTTLVTQVSQAYSIDTHFYESYAMARWAGIGHETALELATYNQWIDVQLSTSAMFPTWVQGSRLRRLFHFPTNKVEYKTGEDSNHGQHVKIYGLTTKNHPFASELLTEGLRSGNLILTGAGLHVLMDSWAHSGNGYSFGHGLLGHWPDRPYTYMEKHNDMRKTLFQAFVAIRKLLPSSALDTELNTTGRGRNVEMNAQDLFETYSKNEVIKKIVESNPMRDPRFLIPTLEQIIASARKNQIVTEEFNLTWIRKTFPGIIESGLDAREITQEVFKYLLELPESEKSKLVNLKEVYARILPQLPVGKTFGGVTITREMFQKQMGEKGQEVIVSELVRLTTWSIVPDEPFRHSDGSYQDDGYTPKAAFEFEGQYLREEKIKVADWQDGLQKLFGTPKIVFAGSNWFTKVVGLLEKSKSKDSLWESMERIEKAQMKFPVRMKYWWYLFKYATVDLIVNSVTQKLVDWKIMKTVYGKARVQADPANMLYQMEEVFDKLVENGFYRSLMTDKDVQKLRTEHSQRLAEERNRLRAMGINVGFAVRSCSKAAPL